VTKTPSAPAPRVNSPCRFVEKSCRLAAGYPPLMRKRPYGDGVSSMALRSTAPPSPPSGETREESPSSLLSGVTVKVVPCGTLAVALTSKEGSSAGSC
jgi:hypothetical protein